MERFEAAIALMAAALLLRSPLSGRFLSWLVTEPVGCPVGKAQAVADAGRAVDAAARVLGDRPRCLTRAAAVGWLLRRRQRPVSLRFGVRRCGGGIEGHAWVELAGEIVYDWSSMAPICARLVPARAPERR